VVGAGFEFRYRLSHQPPTVAEVCCGGKLAPGDLVHLRSGGVSAALSASRRLVGVAVNLEATRAEGPTARVITNADAVYAIVDGDARVAGTSLAVTGESGRQGVLPSDDGPLELVADCAEGELSLVRIKLNHHRGIFLAARAAARGPGLAARQERNLIVAAAAGDPDATAALVTRFMPAIHSVARLYRHTPGVEHAELIQDGVVGLLRAVKRYDSTLGTPFWAYSSWWVRQAMQQLVSEVTRPAVLSDRALRGLARTREARGAFLQEHGREPTVDELAAGTGLAPRQAESLLAIERTPRALGEPVGGPESCATLADQIVDPDAESEYTGVLERIAIAQVRGLIAGLSERERRILRDHYGLDRSARTLRTIGHDLDLSAERVRQIEEQALAKLRAAAVRPRAGV